MNSVITVAQARQITGGRAPHVPVEYEQACTALAACVALEEGKYWSDKADALAAWAKIYRDGTIERQAKILKLRAYKRMGELAKELYPVPKVIGRKQTPKNARGVPEIRGATNALQEAGLSKEQARAAMLLAKKTPEDMVVFEQRKHVPTPTTATSCNYIVPDRAFLGLLAQFASSCRKISPGEARRAWTPLKSKWRDNAEEIHDWLGLLLGDKKSHR